MRVVQVASWFVVVALLVPPAPGVLSSGTTLQLAKEGRTYKSTDSDNDEPLWSRPSGVRVPGRFKTHKGGYDPRRAQRFWRHYRGPKPQEKEKPPHPRVEM
jgi:hypothetical protein